MDEGKGGSVTEQDAFGRRTVTPVQKAYALLWRDMGYYNPYASEARSTLLAAMTRDEQREAIAWVQQKYPVTENEIAHL